MIVDSCGNKKILKKIEKIIDNPYTYTGQKNNDAECKSISSLTFMKKWSITIIRRMQKFDQYWLYKLHLQLSIRLRHTPDQALLSFVFIINLRHCRSHWRTRGCVQTQISLCVYYGTRIRSSLLIMHTSRQPFTDAQLRGKRMCVLQDHESLLTSRSRCECSLRDERIAAAQFTEESIIQLHRWIFMDKYINLF